LFVLQRVIDIPDLAVWFLIGCWVAKDVILYPFVGRFYDPNLRKNWFSMVGKVGTVKEALRPRGKVQVKSELWRAETLDRTHWVAVGEKVRVLTPESKPPEITLAVIQIRLSDQHMESKKILENPYVDIEQAKGIRVAEWLINEKIDELIIKEDITKKGPGYVLSNAGVKIHVVSTDSAEDAIQSVLSSQMQM
jgi:predicted Fe-Mo cluster-binding NifX family protein